jgi:hypothetical protein
MIQQQQSCIQPGDFVRPNNEAVDDKENEPMKVVSVADGNITTEWNAADGTPQTTTHPVQCFYKVPGQNVSADSQ